MPLKTNAGAVTGASFYDAVRENCRQPIELCYQCQKCTAGCPVADFADHPPHRILRMVYLGLREQVLTSSMLWLCSSCETCGSRCPNGIRISELMDALREISAATGKKREKKTTTFHRLFLADVRFRGRVHESMLMARYKLKTGDLFTDLDLGLQLFKKGKLPLLSKSVKDKRQIREMFRRVNRARKQKGAIR